MFQFEYIGYFLIAILGLYILVKVFSWPIRILFKLLVNAVLGALLLVIVNFVGNYFEFYIGINAVTALIAGFFGIPGVIFLVVFKLFF
ncbi:MAG: pro-sigmaK processing inhibitor BofA family protein [Clostridium sp.]|jgi:inhibitor of the pro-sigma K processing machinery|uniref:pro-sigmaK processing inhibitor BofA family protein n=1 Tax=Clostridium sp. TaxID=1506 RepID=UPI0025BFD3DD|nr:pro-sigmaK processing inhibitor BofA family protein [Clostridium sp.]MCH3965431.1 pro-sigmaK processing inhibitor BofA family protein [Clostridium sp.]MCI1717288.1 pro-sigmaK processing inhibitor BofA family protein [Clostridium sp.]MCI1801628.1 pro-sigmaK processing inhibitor BofA family protein [Clostridium sp.]MCI1815474.1 pro-sigmaK processing inhibitor BofA family protein [Clostridium sp.]MCI1872377.1 pro-sigmaK processing inhibitor BofA family protein [Clostridium sp.]